MLCPEDPQGPDAAGDVDPDAAFIILPFRHLDDADLPGPAHMGRTAGAGIVARDGHQAKLPVDLLLAAVGDGLQLFFGRIGHQDLHILVDCPVDDGLHVPDLLLRQRAAEIHSHIVVA